MLTIAIQKSGRIATQTIKLLQDAGICIEKSERALVATATNFPLEVLFLRASDIPEMVRDGVADLGICGQNTIAEKGGKFETLERLGFGECRLSIATTIERANDSLEGQVIATSYPQILSNYLSKEKINAEIITLSGSVEIAPNLSLSDSICDLVSSGDTLRTNNLIETKEIMRSEVELFAAQKESIEDQETLKKIRLRIRGVLSAKQYKYVIMNLPKKSLTKLPSILPGLKSPTVSPLSDETWVSVATVVKEDTFWETIEKLKSVGAEGILVQPIEKMIL